MSLNPKAKDQLRLLLVAAGLAALLILCVLATAVLTPGIYGRRIDWKWVRFGVVTTFFVGYCLRTYWKARKHLTFWGIFLGVLILHLLGVGYFYYAGAGLPLLVFGPVVALEWALLAVAVHHFLGVGPQIRKQ
ncbi:MAG: hypothetical protein WBX38_14085 [Candidatus Sulfotelmatobacter sp.]